jgi:hypothetical protein
MHSTKTSTDSSFNITKIGFLLEEIEYIVAHKGLFQRAPIEEHDEHQEYPYIWRATLDRALLDYIKGPHEVGKKIFSEVSIWLQDEEDTGDFEEVCALAMVPSDTVLEIFTEFRYSNKE